jgi:hypothetical protein
MPEQETAQCALYTVYFADGEKVQLVVRSRPNPLNVTDFCTSPFKVPYATESTNTTHAGLSNRNFWTHPVLGVHNHDGFVVALTSDWCNSALNEFSCAELSCFSFANK